MWKNITINHNQIEAQVGGASIVKLPKSCEYGDYKFFHPTKLIRTKGGMLSLGITEDFEVEIFKNGKGKYNKFEKLDQVQLSGAEILDLFGYEDENSSTFLEVEEPKKVDKNVEVAEDLKND